MRSRFIAYGAVLALAGGLAGCAPGPAGYAGWSHHRQQQANRHAYRANRNAQAAQWQARHGDYYGARQSQAAANAQANAARDAQAHANRDRLLSGY